MSVLMACSTPPVSTSLPLDHDTTAGGVASLTQSMATTIFPSSSSVVLTAGTNSSGLSDRRILLEENPAKFKIHFTEDCEGLRKQTCGNIAAFLLEWVLRCACDSFPVQVVGGSRNGETEVSCSAAVAECRERELGRRGSPNPLTVVLQVHAVDGLHCAHRAARGDLCPQTTILTKNINIRIGPQIFHS